MNKGEEQIIKKTEEDNGSINSEENHEEKQKKLKSSKKFSGTVDSGNNNFRSLSSIPRSTDSDGGMSVISNSINNKNLKNTQTGGPYILTQTALTQKNFDDNASITSFSIHNTNMVHITFIKKANGRSVKAFSKEPAPVDHTAELKKLNDEIKQRDKKLKDLSTNYESIKKIYDEKTKEFQANLSKYNLTSKNNKNLKEKICMMIKDFQKN